MRILFVRKFTAQVLLRRRGCQNVCRQRRQWLKQMEHKCCRIKCWWNQMWRCFTAHPFPSSIRQANIYPWKCYCWGMRPATTEKSAVPRIDEKVLSERRKGATRRVTNSHKLTVDLEKCVCLCVWRMNTLKIGERKRNAERSKSKVT